MKTAQLLKEILSDIAESIKGANLSQDCSCKVQNVSLGGAKEVEARLELGLGKLEISGGASELMEGEFTYKDQALEPKVNYKVEDSIGKLKVSPHCEDVSYNRFSGLTQEWKIRFSNHIPLNLRVSAGVGKSLISLQDINLNHLRIESGVGSSTINLCGKWKTSFSVKLEGGIGKYKLLLPKDIGVKLDVSKGIGSLKGTGLILAGTNTYVNQAYEETDVKIDIKLDMGIGGIEIELV